MIKPLVEFELDQRLNFVHASGHHWYTKGWIIQSIPAPHGKGNKCHCVTEIQNKEEQIHLHCVTTKE